MGIKNMSPRSGRMLKENDTVVNQADMLEAIYNALVVVKNEGVTITGSSGDISVAMATALSKDIDSIDVGKMTKGGVITVHSAIAASVTLTNTPETNISGYNAGHLSLNVDSGTPTFTFDLYGAAAAGGTYQKLYKKDTNTAQSLTGITASGMYPMTGLPNYLKIVPTLTTGTGTITVKFIPAVLL